MIGFGQAMFDATLGADPAEDVADESRCGVSVMLDELHAVVSEYRMDPIGHGPDQGGP
jgi:hypothetical protein